MYDILTVYFYVGRRWGHHASLLEYLYPDELILYAQLHENIVVRSLYTKDSRIPECFTHSFRSGRYYFCGTRSMLSAIKYGMLKTGTPIKKR